MKDAKGHGSEGRGGASGQPTQARALRHRSAPAPRRRSVGGGGGSGGGGSGGGGGGSGGGQGHPKSGAHTFGIHKAVTGKTLAQWSAAGTNPAIPPPKIRGTS
jgi:hypothetical protein